ncbi:MAG: methyltransferase domain-containing protein [Acidobacteriota bacterium]
MSLRRALARLRVSPPVNQLRYHAYRDVLMAFPRRHQCNLCKWTGRRFLTFVHRSILCPKCGSMVRHRLIGAALTECADLRSVIHSKSAVLHMSAEYCLRRVIEPIAGEYVRGDFMTADCDIHVDLTNMHEIADGRFDVLIACDVIEHIENDIGAFREIRRVLRPGGTAIITVPQVDAEVATYVDSAQVTEAQRTAAFGQHDHVKLYGNDFADRLRSAGFTVRVVEAGDFTRELVERHVLSPPVLNPPPFDFNRRRIFFARA